MSGADNKQNEENITTTITKFWTIITTITITTSLTKAQMRRLLIDDDSEDECGGRT